MRCSVILTVLFLMLPLAELRSQPSVSRQAESFFSEAVKLIDAGEYDKAWDLLVRADEQFPELAAWKFEMGYIRMAQGKFEDALELFRDIINAPEANARFYSMLGNAYDLTGDPDSAILTYETGIRKFPDAGELYLELGVMRAQEENYAEALETWETGLTRDPSHPSNFFHAAGLYLPTEFRGWGMMYGEIYLNLEPSSERSGAIRTLLWDAYDDAVSITPGESDSSYSIEVSFWKDATNLYATDSGLMAPFSYFFEKEAILPAIEISRVSDNGPTIRSLHDFRVGFISGWYGEKNREVAEFFDVTLFDYHRRLIDAGHFMAYNVLIFYNEKNQEEVQAWIEENPNGINRLVEWIEKNPWPATENPFSRLTLEMMPTIPFGADDAELEGKYELLMPDIKRTEEE